VGRGSSDRIRGRVIMAMDAVKRVEEKLRKVRG